MKELPDMFDASSNELTASTGATNEELSHQQHDKATELKKVRKKLKRLKNRADDRFCILTKKEKKKLKRYKREKRKLEKQLSVIETKISNHDERLARTEESISLIIPEVLKMRSSYRQQIIQKLLDCNTPKEAESCLKLLEGGGVYDKKL